jgi:hypothetical protein
MAVAKGMFLICIVHQWFGLLVQGDDGDVFSVFLAEGGLIV